MTRIILVLLVFLYSSVLAQNDSAIKIDVEKLNGQIAYAAQDGASWTESTLQVTQKLFGGNQRNFLAIAEDELKCSEDTDKISVVIMRGSFSRPWGQGDWCEVHFRRVDDGTWRLCYVLPMAKEGARIRNQHEPMKARRAVQLVE